LPEQAPTHSRKTELGPGIAARVTTVPGVYEYVHVCGTPGVVLPQFAFGGSTFTMPRPFSTLSTVTASDCGPRNLAATDVAASTVTWQAPLPEQAPTHSRKTELGPGIAARVTTVPGVYEYVHVCGVPGVLLPQYWFGGITFTMPRPFSTLSTVTASDCGPRNLAVTYVAASTLTWQAPLPEQAPAHSRKTEPGPGVAARVTTVPGVYEYVHVCGTPGVLLPQYWFGGITFTTPRPFSTLSTVTDSGRVSEIVTDAVAGAEVSVPSLTTSWAVKEPVAV
jgi:hypothetical protein